MNLCEIGVMQGRLLPKYKGRYQAHPVGYWQEEFSLAAELDLNLIEFIFDFNDAGKNPLMNELGLEEILILSEKTGVAVKSICADYFMKAPLHNQMLSVVKESQKKLEQLIINASKIGVRDIVIPCVDQSSLADSKAISRFIENISFPLELAEKKGVNLTLETDLAPDPFGDLLDKLDSPRITVNYDTGNSASLGYDPEEELAAYGSRISDIHIKDRLRGGGSVELGTGDTDLDSFFSAISKIDYSGPFIMQAYRDDEGVEVFKKQLEWVMPYLEQLYD